MELARAGVLGALGVAMSVACTSTPGDIEPRFHVIADGGGLRTARNGGLEARFDGSGVELRTEGGGAGRLEARAIRCDDGEAIALGGAPMSDRDDPHRVFRASAGATEWYVNGPLGLEHGFDLELACDRSLSVEIATPGFTPAIVGADVRLSSRDAALRYAKLSVHDRDGRALPASFEVGDARITISVEVAAAIGPITIDPLVYVEEQRLRPSSDGTGTSGDRFGDSVALSGDTVLVGAPADDLGANQDQGAAYVFVRTGPTWSLQAKVTASDGADRDWFGASVALSGDTAIVGVPGSDIGPNASQGSAYVYVRSGGTWSPQAKLIASDGEAGDGFGAAVALEGDRAIVGAQAAAYVFGRGGATWSEQFKLTATDGLADDRFGSSVALSGDTALVGAPAVLGSGSAYVFVRSGSAWIQQQRLSTWRISIGEYVADFGRAVALSGDTALIGSPGDGIAFFDAGLPGLQVPDVGGAYVFVRSGTTWSWQADLVANGSGAGSFIGHAVALVGDNALVAAPGMTVGGNPEQGSATLFVRSGVTWARQMMLTAGGGAAGDGFGASVALSASPAWGHLTAVGAPYRDGIAIDEGAAYLGRIATNAPCAGVPAGTICRGSRGACDVVEVCDGLNDACPADATIAAGTVCRASAGVCDVAEVCDGTGGDCPVDRFVDGDIVCRASTAPCDRAERCVDGRADCPADGVAPAGTACRAAAGGCDVEETCDGARSTCPADRVAAAGTECRGSRSECDVAEVCAGGTAACPADRFVVAGAPCGDASDSVCDRRDSCDGAGACTANLASPATICREATSACDVAETCDGVGGCPADVVVPGGTVFGAPVPCGAPGGCAAGGRRASPWLGLALLGLWTRRRRGSWRNGGGGCAGATDAASTRP